jgi:hypothetical protein
LIDLDDFVEHTPGFIPLSRPVIEPLSPLSGIARTSVKRLSRSFASQATSAMSRIW